MPETVVKTPWGTTTVSHPQGASDDEIIAYAKEHAKPPFQMADVAQSIAAAPRKVAEGLVGLPGTIEQGVTGAQNAMNEAVVGGLKKLGINEQPTPLKTYLPTPAAIQEQTSKVLGPSYQPQTQPGKYAGAVTEGALGGLAGPGSIIPKLLIGAGAGAGSEAGKEYSPDHPIVGSLLGGIAGGGIIGGFGKAGEAVRNYSAANTTGRNLGNIIGGGDIPAGSVRRLAKSAADDQLTMQGVKATQQQLGPTETMVMDLGRQLQGRAEQMAVQPGAAQNKILDAVEGRTGQFGAETARRVAQTMDANLGKSQDVVRLIDAIDNLVQSKAGPAYTQLKKDYPNISIPAAITDRPAVSHAMQQAEGIAANYGKKVSATAPNIEYWDYVKKGMDARINGLMRNGIDDLSSAQKADLGGLMDAKNALVSHLDNVTQGQYANARAIAATKPELHEAMDFGRGIFNSKMLPEEVSAQLSGMSIPAREIAKIGARKEIERVIGNARNEGAKARSFLDTNNNTAKIEALFGKPAADAIANRVAAENTFQQATENVARNSRTAVRTELAKDTQTLQPTDIHATLTGMVTSPVRSGLAYALQHGMEKTRTGISDVLTQKEGNLPAVVEQLLNYNAKKAANRSAPTSQQLSALARALMTIQAGQ